jgi:hypothetical protein
MPVTPATGEAKVGGLKFKMLSIWKITKAKRAGVMAEVIECLSSKYKTLVQTPELPKEKEKIS